MTDPETKITAGQMRTARALIAWSRKYLADQSHVPPSAVADFEQGRGNQVSSAHLEAIRAALDRAGVSISPDGTVSGPLPALSPSSRQGGSAIRWVDVTDLSQWADRRDAEEGLPELLSQLIRAATGLAAHIEFPSGASIRQEGWDGTCDIETGVDYVPSGSSGWEVTTQREGITAKATADYEKRCADPRNRDPRHTTFVFVSLRPWNGKQKWEQTRIAEGRWASVRAFDADDLVQWIDLYPAVGNWLAVRIRKRPPGLRQLAEAWEEWALSSQPPMTADLTLAGRDEEAAKVLQWLYQPAGLLAVQGDSPEEAVAFVHATLDQLPLQRRLAYHVRCLVADTADAARVLRDSLSPLIVILNEPDPGLAASLIQHGHHVYLPSGSVVGSLEDTIILRRPPQEFFEEALLGMGLSRQEAERLTHDSARSLSILRRRIPAAPTGRAPDWADSGHARPLSPALLAGGWDEGKVGDRNALEQLARQEYDAFAGQLARWLSVPDSPFRKAGTAWQVASPRDAWFLLAGQLTSGDLDTFTSVAVEVLGSPDPRFELASDERWLAAARGQIPEFSGLLRHGIAQTLALLGVFGVQARNVLDPTARAEAIVLHLLRDADARRWWSLSALLDVLAEATPEVFLRMVDDSLSQPEPPVVALLREDTGLAGGAHHAHLLWGLEMLAGDSRCLGRVAQLLARMARLDPGGRYLNRPINSLKHIFSLWLPQTNASFEERFRVLDRLRVVENAIGWELLLGILLTGHDIGGYSRNPRWRDFSAVRIEPLPNAEIMKGMNAVCERLLEDAGIDGARWVQLIERLSNLPPKWRSRAIDSLAGAATRITDRRNRSEIWKALRKLLNAHREHPAAEWALPEDTLGRLDEIYDAFHPADPIESVAWLFQHAPVDLPRPTGRGWEADNELAAEIRRDAASATLTMGGIDGIFALASAVNVAGLVGVALVEAPGDEVQKNAILSRAMERADSASEGLAFGMIDAQYKRHGDPWADTILARAQADKWPSASIVRVLLMLPVSKPTWDRAAALGEEVERLYWTRVGLLRIQTTPEDRSIAVTKLLAVGRAYEGIHLLGHSSDGVPSALLVQVLVEAVIPTDARESGDLSMVSYSLAAILKKLDVAGDIGEDQIAGLEWKYLPLLRHSTRPPTVLPKFMARTPEFFLQVLNAAFEPIAAARAQEDAPPDDPNRRAVARQAFDLLEEWDQVPGDIGGKMDGAVLEAWATRARSLCADAGLSEYGDIYIGHALAHAPSGPDGVWPPVPVRDAIERVRSPKLEQGIITGRRNMRGVTTRAVDEGGEQERTLAQQYRQMAAVTASEWPRTTDMLEQLAGSLEGEGQWHDQDAERIDWSS